MPTVITQGAASAKGYGFGARATAANYIEDVFSTWLYTGTGASQTITNGVDLSTKGGMVWIKSRNDTTNNFLFDTARGTTKEINSNTTDAEATLANSLTAFNANGFTVSSATGIGTNANTYASWTFRKQPKFFDVVTYTGDGTNTRNISHNLGSAPGCVMVKATSTTSDWFVWHRSLAAYNFMFLNTQAASATGYQFGAGTQTFSSSVFTVGAQGPGPNVNGVTYVAYLFAHDAGGFGASGTDNVISCGSYTGNGSATGPTISLGYEPQWVLIKQATNAGTRWTITDNMRGFPVTSSGQQILQPNLNNAEIGVMYIQPTSTGFKVVDTDNDVNFNGATYIYIAIRRGPMKTPTTGTSVFALAARSDGVGDAGLAGSTNSFVNQRPDLSVFANRAGNAKNFQFANSLTGYQQTTGPGADTLTTPTLSTASTGAEATSGNAIYVLPANGSNPPEVRFASDSVGAKIGYIFRRAPGFFDVVCYTGTGANTTQTHNLGVVPELMIVKNRDVARNWSVYTASTGATKYLNLSTADAATLENAVWNNTAPTASVFSLGPSGSTNENTRKMVAYLFATVAGVSKVGSYTGTGTTNQINCGFTGGARFVMIKRTDSTGDWYVWDTARGIVAANDPYLLLNSTAAEVTNTDYVDTYSAGFELSSTAPAAINANGGTFIFWAVA